MTLPITQVVASLSTRIWILEPFAMCDARIAVDVEAVSSCMVIEGCHGRAHTCEIAAA